MSRRKAAFSRYSMKKAARSRASDAAIMRLRLIPWRSTPQRIAFICRSKISMGNPSSGSRTLGGIVAGAFFVIPSIFVVLLLSYIYAAYGNVAAIAGMLDGFKPVVVAIVVEALLKIGGRALKREVHYAVAVLAFVGIYYLH